MLFQLKKLPEIINLTCFLKSFWILYIDQIIVYNTFYSTLTFYIIKDRCQMHALKVFRSPVVWLLLHKLSSPHYRYIRKMRRGDRLPLTQIREDLNASKKTKRLYFGSMSILISWKFSNHIVNSILSIFHIIITVHLLLLLIIIITTNIVIRLL